MNRIKQIFGILAIIYTVFVIYVASSTFIASKVCDTNVQATIIKVEKYRNYFSTNDRMTGKKYIYIPTFEYWYDGKKYTIRNRYLITTRESLFVEGKKYPIKVYSKFPNMWYLDGTPLIQSFIEASIGLFIVIVIYHEYIENFFVNIIYSITRGKRDEKDED